MRTLLYIPNVADQSQWPVEGLREKYEDREESA